MGCKTGWGIVLGYQSLSETPLLCIYLPAHRPADYRIKGRRKGINHLHAHAKSLAQVVCDKLASAIPKQDLSVILLLRTYTPTISVRLEIVGIFY